MQIEYNKPITDQFIQYCLESAPANISVSMEPNPQLTLATVGKQSGSTLSGGDVTKKASGQLHKNISSVSEKDFQPVIQPEKAPADPHR